MCEYDTRSTQRTAADKPREISLPTRIRNFLDRALSRADLKIKRLSCPQFKHMVLFFYQLFYSEAQFMNIGLPKKIVAHIFSF